MEGSLYVVPRSRGLARRGPPGLGHPLPGREEAFPGPWELAEAEVPPWTAQPWRPLAHCICLVFHRWSQILLLQRPPGSRECSL